VIGAPAIGAFIAFWGFWVLLLAGWLRQALGLRGILLFLALWIAGRLALNVVLNGLLFTPYVAMLDIALVFVVFQGDVRLT